MLDEKINNFFQREVFDLDEDEVDTFLSNYSAETVIQCLFDNLKFYLHLKMAMNGHGH